MQNKFLTVVALLGGLFSTLLTNPALAQTKTYSAQAIHALPGQPETYGSIVKSGQNLRLEYEEAGRRVIQILLPTAGAMYVLDPAAQTYIEYLGPAVPVTDVEGYASPCPNQKPSQSCQHVGDDIISGVKVERWALASGEPGKPLVILWNSPRRRALRQDFPDGGSMVMAFQAMQDLNGRATEHWIITLTGADNKISTGDWWFDPDLRVVVRETLPSGETRRLENITLGPVDPALFQVPRGWRKIEAPQQPIPPALKNPVPGSE